MQHESSGAKSPLQRYVGSWQGEVTVDGAAVEPHRYTQSNTFAWILGGRFLEERGTGSNGTTFLGVWGLDASTGHFRAHYFMAPSGDIVVLTHRWDEKSQTFTGSADLGGGIQMVATDRFLDRDTYEWSFAISDPAGKVLTRMHAREQRVTGPLT